MGFRLTLWQIVGLFSIFWTVAGCADEFLTLHSASGDPLLISRRAYTIEGCTEKLKEDAARMGFTFRYLHMRGSVVGRSLLWPFEPGYACEAAIGPEQRPSGVIPIGAGNVLRSS